MRKINTFIVACLTACVSLAAGPSVQKVEVATGALDGGTSTITSVIGYIEDIQVVCTDGVSTGSVEVAYVPADTAVAAVNLATNSVVASKLFKPRVDGTDVTGAALTSDPPGRYFIVNDAIRLIVTGSPTGKTWRAYVKFNDK